MARSPLLTRPRPRARWSWLSLGLPAHVLFKALAPAFFARENTTTPLVSVLKGIVLATAAAFLFGHLFGADGIAAAIALGAWSSALSLLREGATRFGFSLDAAARQTPAAHRARGAGDGRPALAGARDPCRSRACTALCRPPPCSS